MLLSAGIGATPVLAMLHALAAARSTRQVLWLHAARDRQHHPFAAEVRRLMRAPHARPELVCYSRPAAADTIGRGLRRAPAICRARSSTEIGVPRDADVYLCGPTRFMAEMKEALAGLGVAPERIHVEIFNGSESLTPGCRRRSHASAAPARSTTPTPVRWCRSRAAASPPTGTPSAYQSILELAEACDVPVRWSCRTGVCHNCESGLVSGDVVYAPEPLDKPATATCSSAARDPWATSSSICDLAGRAASRNPGHRSQSGRGMFRTLGRRGGEEAVSCCRSLT